MMRHVSCQFVDLCMSQALAKVKRFAPTCNLPLPGKLSGRPNCYNVAISMEINSTVNACKQGCSPATENHQAMPGLKPVKSPTSFDSGRIHESS